MSRVSTNVCYFNDRITTLNSSLIGSSNCPLVSSIAPKAIKKTIVTVPSQNPGFLKFIIPFILLLILLSPKANNPQLSILFCFTASLIRDVAYSFLISCPNTDMTFSSHDISISSDNIKATNDRLNPYTYCQHRQRLYKIIESFDMYQFMVICFISDSQVPFKNYRQDNAWLSQSTHNRRLYPIRSINFYFSL